MFDLVFQLSVMYARARSSVVTSTFLRYNIFVFHFFFFHFYKGNLQKGFSLSLQHEQKKTASSQPYFGEKNTHSYTLLYNVVAVIHTRLYINKYIVCICIPHRNIGHDARLRNE